MNVQRIALQLQTAVVLILSFGVSAAHADMVGINVQLTHSADQNTLANLGSLGEVLDVIPEINAVTMRINSSDLPAIQALPCVVAANPDRRRSLTRFDCVAPGPDFFGGASLWNLDAIDVTNAAGGRSVAYDGQGVYVAVVDSGLVDIWRSYFPEQRIDTVHARAFGGGGGERGTISEQPDKWEHDTLGHGTAVASVMLGFHYCGVDANLPVNFNGVAPRVTVIPVRVLQGNNSQQDAWSSVMTRGVLYAAGLKVSGALGDAPLVINLSVGGDGADVIERAALDYAIAHGVIVVGTAGNLGETGMTYPGAYPPVISAGATGPSAAFPSDDPTTIEWILRDVAEGDPAPHYVAPFSGRELPGQELDLIAPGTFIPVPRSNNGQPDYDFAGGTSFSGPHVAAVAALMLQKNPSLMQVQVETILRNTAMPLPPDCRDVTFVGIGPGNPPTWGDHNNVFFFNTTFCWGANATGAGLVQADAALAATPLP